jgi:hypothetical protein
MQFFSEPSTPAQRTVFVVVIALVAAVLGLGLWLLYDLHSQLPTIPVKDGNMTVDEFNARVKGYQDLCAAIRANSSSMAEVTIKPLIQIFTAIVASVLTFVFAKAALYLVTARRAGV